MCLCILCASLGRAQLTLTFAPSAHNGYNITCFGAGDGAIDLSVSGGTPPYTYDWSNGATTQDISNLRAGYYEVRVRDSGTLTAKKDITLTEPRELDADVVPYLYPSGYNISCFNCFNGSIAVTAGGGVQPYTYEWADGPTVEDRTQLDAGSYQVTVYDANSCRYKGNTFQLTQPERDDWTKSGNAGTDPSTQFIGTTDNKDVVFKSNGTEDLRLLSAGGVRLPSLAFTNGFRPVYADSTGRLRHLTENDLTNYYVDPCAHGSPYPWTWCGNQVPASARLGTLNAQPLKLVTNNNVRVIITPEGKVGIGATPTAGNIDQYRLFVEDGIVARDVLVKHGAWPDYVFAEGYGLMPLAQLRVFLHEHNHMPGLPSAAELDKQGGVALGTHAREITRTVEEQALYILQLEEKLQAMEQRLKALETSKH